MGGAQESKRHKMHSTPWVFVRLTSITTKHHGKCVDRPICRSADATSASGTNSLRSSRKGGSALCCRCQALSTRNQG
eukprot:2650747-Rhodomonas_salina.1